MNHMDNPKYGYFKSNYFIILYMLVLHGDILINIAQAIMVNRYQGVGGYLDHIKD